SVKLGELPTDQTADASQATPEQQSETALANYGLTVAPAEDGAGVVVTDVNPDSPAADAGIRAGDKVVEVNNEAVASAGDVEKELKAVTDSGRKAALMLLERDDTSRFVAIPTERG
ncbi:MAG: PDZ domain-containing protein, partial [Oricola sp.]|nr:PDZ domain-containing protein [Oricola sp.]